MRKRLLLAVALLTIATALTARSQGMWIPSLIGKERIQDMQNKGLKLTAEDLYSINAASLKDAIVRFGGGCTGEMISDQGLLLTNHHCGYSQIQAHSSLKNDYLTDGFAAQNRSQELANPGLKVEFLHEMRDVTAESLKGIKPSMTPAQRDAKIKENNAKIVKSAEKTGSLQASIEPLYYGNQYYLFTYKIYKDVRLVFAPASSIGKFGGDTDNWMWPRHTGDFSIFRVYADKNNEPADYSPDNQPYVPKKSFTISTKGVQEDDFTFVYGYPGSTQQYLHSAAVDYIQNTGDPTKIALRTKRLEIMNAAQAADPAVRIQYAAKNASVSNAWKKWQGELLGLQRLGTIDKKIALEKQFEIWAADKPEYQGLTTKFQTLYDSIAPYAFALDYYAEAPLAVELVRFASRYIDPKATPDYNDFYKNYVKSIDSTAAEYLLDRFISDVPASMRPDSMSDAQDLVHTLFNQSLFLDSTALKSATRAQIEADPAYQTAARLTKKRNADIFPAHQRLNSAITNLYATYMRGLMLMLPDYPYFPDANFTLRIAYGKVNGYTPRDAVYYTPQSTLDGVMQKDNPTIYDYDVPQKLRAIYKAKDFGRWAVNGTVPVCFIATNHTTGGNSGSPVLNANGELIGINFDRVWEGTMSDLDFDPTVCRNIALDVRYVLFIMDKLYHAGYLLDEMKFSK